MQLSFDIHTHPRTHTHTYIHIPDRLTFRMEVAGVVLARSSMLPTNFTLVVVAHVVLVVLVVLVVVVVIVYALV